MIDYNDLVFTAKERYMRVVLRGLLEGLVNSDLTEEDLDFMYGALQPMIEELECNDFFGTEGIVI